MKQASTTEPAMRRRKRKEDFPPGGFGGLPKVVWKHPDYQQLSGNAVKLLMDFACQYDGSNNGDLSAAYSDLKKRGWRSKGTIAKALEQLIDAEMVIRTREGKFLNPGGTCALYALTWKSIDDCEGKNLEVKSTITPRRKFSGDQSKNPGPKAGQRPVQTEGRVRPRDAMGRFLSDQ
ncbi:hypothetical protein [Congregibacter litoralis]|uniref:Helix-turn-helix domain-containing protein n=1 Tax=Congregibacter litoralis KT71 TaxID=314285 RepID=A4AB11_9GAMM|nr:hypothetical protein [Congregibacter litoralis]EAQ96883.1 hypothetical protein KT71_11299 [Congregibacter litoralis KT71]